MKKREYQRKLTAYRVVNAELREQIADAETRMTEVYLKSSEAHTAWRVREARITELEMLVQRLQDPEGYARVVAEVKDLEEQAHVEGWTDYPMWIDGKSEGAP